MKTLRIATTLRLGAFSRSDNAQPARSAKCTFSRRLRATPRQYFYERDRNNSPNTQTTGATK